jgi:hypothetical protein
VALERKSRAYKSAEAHLYCAIISSGVPFVIMEGCLMHLIISSGSNTYQYWTDEETG